MYKVMEIIKCTATNFIDLKNVKTGTIDRVFDDSSVVDVSYSDFSFMKKGNTYDCKIKLMGEFTEENIESSVEVRIIDMDILVGEKHMIEVQINNDIYYIPRSKIDNIYINQRLYFDFTRKDLIQVDNIIHGNYLNG